MKTAGTPFEARPPCFCADQRRPLSRSYKPTRENENGPRSEDGEPLCSNQSGARRPFGPALPRSRSALGVTGVLGCEGRIRTCDLRGMNPALSQLSYPAIVRFFRASGAIECWRRLR